MSRERERDEQRETKRQRDEPWPPRYILATATDEHREKFKKKKKKKLLTEKKKEKCLLSQIIKANNVDCYVKFKTFEIIFIVIF